MPILEHIPAPGKEKYLKGIQSACASYTAKGITSAQDVLYLSGRLGGIKAGSLQRIVDHPCANSARCSTYNINQFNTTISDTPLSADHKLSLGAAKLLADGSLQGYRILSNPYHKVIYDFPEGAMWRGYPTEPEQQFTERIVSLHRQSWQLAIHSNGDDAIQMILNAYEEAQKQYPRTDARRIVIHCQTVREDQLDRIR